MGPEVAPVQNTISDTKVLWGSKDFTGPSLSINLNTFGGKTYSINPSNITESKTLNVSPEATISASYTVKLEDSPVRVVEVEGTNIDLKTYTPVQPTGIYWLYNKCWGDTTTVSLPTLFFCKKISIQDSHTLQ